MTYDDAFRYLEGYDHASDDYAEAFKIVKDYIDALEKRVVIGNKEYGTGKMAAYTEIDAWIRRGWTLDQLNEYIEQQNVEYRKIRTRGNNE